MMFLNKASIQLLVDDRTEMPAITMTRRQVQLPAQRGHGQLQGGQLELAQAHDAHGILLGLEHHLDGERLGSVLPSGATQRQQ